MIGSRNKYPPEMVAKWAKGLANGSLTKEQIRERWGINDRALYRKLEQHRETEQVNLPE
jgi:hypothetical protein